jgi:hypothetical protein
MQIINNILLTNKLQVLSALNYLAILSFFIRAITGNIIFLFIGAALGGFIFLYFLFINKKIPRQFFYVSIVVVLSYLITYMNNGFSHGSLFIVLFLSCASIAWAIARYGINYWFAWTIFYGSALYCFLRIYYFDASPNDLFAYSRNHVSVYFINAISLLYIAAYQEKRKTPILPAILTFLISVMSVGTGGIFSSAILLWFILIWYILKNFKSYKIISIYLTLSILYHVVSFWDIGISGLVATFDLQGDIVIKLQSSQITAGNARYQIWSEYINSLDIIRVLAGVSLSEEFYGYSNLHSSYLLLHARMGFLSFFLVLMFMYSLVRLYKKNYVFFICYMVILLRGITDTTFLAGSSFDFVLLFFFIFSVSPIYKGKGYGGSV